MRKLKINSLPKKKHWVDRDEIMLHACFQILQDFVEVEKFENHIPYEHNEKFVDEVRALYKWWKKRKNEYPPFENKKDKKDTKMLKRLMKIRSNMWT